MHRPELPPDMRAMISEGAWPKGFFKAGPSLRAIAPFLDFPFDLRDDQGLPPPFANYFDKTMKDVDNPFFSRMYSIARGSRSPVPVQLPWLDVEQMHIIGCNAYHGDDCLFVLDYRPSRTNPVILASQYIGRPPVIDWVFIALDWRAFLDAIVPFAPS
jgi:hypothetical protein